MEDSSRHGATQVVAYTGTAAASTAFSAQTRQIRVCANSACHIAFGAAPTADVTTAALLPANWVEYITVTPGQKISAIRAATDGLITATSGTLVVTEIV